MKDSGREQQQRMAATQEQPQRQTLRMSHFRLLTERHADLLDQLGRIAVGDDAAINGGKVSIRRGKRGEAGANFAPVAKGDGNGAGS